MGGICGKPTDGRVSLSKDSSEPRLKRGESFRVKSRTGSVDRRLNCSSRFRDDHYEKREVSQVFINMPRVEVIPKGVEGQQVVAGWPSWLAAVAGEAIDGWLPRQADTFEKFDKSLLLTKRAKFRFKPHTLLNRNQNVSTDYKSFQNG